MPLHERKYASLGLRLAGLVLLGLGALIWRHLFAVSDPAARFKVLPYLLGLIGIASTSTGAALAALGHHLFDQIDLSPRWTVHTAAREARARSARLRAGDAQ